MNHPHIAAFIMQAALPTVTMGKSATGSDLQQEIAVLIGQIPLSMWTCWLLEHIKNSTWVTAVSQHSAALNRWIALAAAFLTSAGLNWGISGGMGTGWDLHLHIPAAAVLVHFFAIDVPRNYGIQQVFYRQAVKIEP